MKKSLIVLLAVVLCAVAVFAAGDAKVVYEIDGVSKVTQLADASIAADLACTNTQAVTLSGLIVRLNCQGQAAGFTNTITLNALSTTDNVFMLVNTGTNDLGIAQSGTFLSPALVVEPKGACVIVQGATNAFYAVP
jgi:hypothetical protein